MQGGEGVCRSIGGGGMQGGEGVCRSIGGGGMQEYRGRGYAGV